MKRRALLAHLLSHDCRLKREGRKHSVWWNPSTRQCSTVPRHTEIEDHLARKICKDLGIPSPQEGGVENE